MRGGVIFAVYLAIAVGVLWWVPELHAIPLSGLMLYAPDAGWLLVLNGALAIIALIVSAFVTAFLIRQSGNITASTAEPVDP